MGLIDTVRKYRFETIGILAFILILFLPAAARLALDFLWYDSVGYAGVFLVKYETAIALFIVFAALSTVILLLIGRSGRKTLLRSGRYVVSPWDSRFFTGYQRGYITVKPAEELSAALEVARLPLYIIISFFSLIFGLMMSGTWLTVLMYLNRTLFGSADPVFNKDISFYVFTLPFYKIILNYFIFILLISLLVLTGLYFAFNWKLLLRMPPNLISVMAGLLLALSARAYLGRYSILYSETGVVYGAGYIDVTIRQYIPILLSLVFLFSALGLAWQSKHTPKILAAAAAALVLILILGGATTVIIQEYKVSPNELELEKPYILNNIELTNAAYDLQDVTVRQYPLSFGLSTDILNDPSITNIRLWDYRPLLTTYQQKQAIRTYYGFNDVDVDRYYINGSKNQVWLSAREIFYDQLRGKADTWLNKHVLYTHGIGIVMSPVNTVIDQGLPEMYIENIPPVSNIPSITIGQPRIYYGEKTDTYIFTGTGREEFDYPSGSANIFITYNGTGGIRMEGLNKLVATLALGEFKILTSPDISGDSRLHINRNVMERTALITPYLMQDPDAYVVVDDSGRIYWMVNTFVHANTFPYSEPLWVGSIQMNYIRDSARAVIDAYNGTVTYYMIKDDPLLTTYSRIFPGVFKPYDEMPTSLQQHMRYSPDLFLIQSQIYNDYHMKVPEVFYNREDRWQIATEKYANSLIQVEPYNVLLDLNGSLNFIMMLPFTPSNKNNMIAWMAVNQDPPNYGEIFLYEFSKEKLIYGPAQVEALIDQDEEISKDLTLWSQGGSNVIRGNLLVIPILNSILYIEPLYISAETSSSIPELKKILVVYENKVAMADSLEQAVRKVMGTNISGAPEFDTTDKSQTELLFETLSHYKMAREYLAMGDLENYAKEMKIVDGLMARLEQSLMNNM